PGPADARGPCGPGSARLPGGLGAAWGRDEGRPAAEGCPGRPGTSTARVTQDPAVPATGRPRGGTRTPWPTRARQADRAGPGASLAARHGQRTICPPAHAGTENAAE